MIYEHILHLRKMGIQGFLNFGYYKKLFSLQTKVQYLKTSAIDPLHLGLLTLSRYLCHHGNVTPVKVAQYFYNILLVGDQVDLGFIILPTAKVTWRRDII